MPIDVPPIPMRTTANLNLRSEPGGSNAIAMIDKGEIIGLDGDITVTVNGVRWVPVVIEGWVSSEYLESV